MRRSPQWLLATVAFVATGALAFIPPSALPKARVAASLARRGVLRMDAGEEGPKLAKIEQLKVCSVGVVMMKETRNVPFAFNLIVL